MLLYQCDECEKTFSATDPKICPYCGHTRLRLLSRYKVQIFHISDIQPTREKYATTFTLQSDVNNIERVIPETLCNILKLPSISIRHSIEDPYSSRFKRSNRKSSYETPLTTELRVYSPKRAYVLLDTEDEEIFDYLVTQYKRHGWNVLDLRESQISFVQIMKRFLSTLVIPRLKNDVVRKDISCMITNSGDSSDNDSC